MAEVTFEASKKALASLGKEEQELVREYLQIQKSYKQVYEMFKPLEDEYRSKKKVVSDLLKDVDGQRAKVDDLVVEYAGYERKTKSYKDLFKAALALLNKEQKKVLEQMEEEFTKITEVAKVDVSSSEAMQTPKWGSPGIISKIKTALKSAASSIKKKIMGLLDGAISLLRNGNEEVEDAVNNLARVVEQGARESLSEPKSELDYALMGTPIREAMFDDLFKQVERRGRANRRGNRNQASPRDGGGRGGRGSCGGTRQYDGKGPRY